jgi:tetratricopeptide (TPR) repeat protein
MDHERSPDEAILRGLSTSRVEAWYLSAWRELAGVDEDSEAISRPTLWGGALLIARNLTRYGRSLDSLVRLEASAWSRGVALMSYAVSTRGSVLEAAIESALVAVLASVTPAEVAANPLRAWDNGVPDRPPYLFLSSIDDWFCLVAVRELVDDELRKSGSRLDDASARIIRERGRLVAVRLLQKIAELPRMQREALTLSMWRSDRRRLKEILLDLAHGAKLSVPVEELFPLTVDESLDSDREVSIFMHRDEGKGAAKVAANRSIARRKLIAEDAGYAPLLSAMLPYKKGAASDVSEPSDPELARAFEEAADDGARAFELLMQVSCNWIQPLLPAYRRAQGIGEARSVDQTFRQVGAHVSSCGRCNRILHSEWLLADRRHLGSEHSGAQRMNKKVERVAVDLMRRRSGGQLILKRLAIGMTRQVEIAEGTVKALEQLSTDGVELDDSVVALLRHRAPTDAHPLPVRLAASRTRGEVTRVVLASDTGAWGSLIGADDGIHLRLSGLPRSVNGKIPRIDLLYEDANIPSHRVVTNKTVSHGAITVVLKGLDESRLPRISHVNVDRPVPRSSSEDAVSNRLAAKTREARESGKPQEALSYSTREIEVRERAGPARVLAETRRRTGAICLELGRLDDAEKHMLAAYQEAETLGERRVVCDAERGLGEIWMRRADWEKATTHFDAALSVAHTLDKKDKVHPDDQDRRVATILTARAGLLFEQGKATLAQEAIAESLTLFERHGDVVGCAAALNVRALIQRRADEIDEALDTCQRARELLLQAQAPNDSAVQPKITERAGRAATPAQVTRLEAEIMCTEGRIYHAVDNTTLAMLRFRESLEKMYKVGYRSGEGDAISAIGRVYEALADDDLAILSFQRAIHIFKETDDELRIAAVTGTLARAYLTQARRSEGKDRLKSLEEACKNAKESLNGRKNKRGEAISLTLLADIELEWDNYEKELPKATTPQRGKADSRPELSRGPETKRIRAARENYMKAVAIREEVGDTRGLVVTLSNLAELEYKLKKSADAEVLLEKALRCMQTLRNPRIEIGALGLLGEVREARGDYASADDARWQAVELVERGYSEIEDRDQRRRYFSKFSGSHRRLACALAFKDSAAALLLAEASRARGLLEKTRAASDAGALFTIEASRPWLAKLKESVEANTAAVSYLIEENESFAFVVSSNGVTPVRLKPSGALIRHQAREMVAAVANGEPKYPHGESLFRTLIEPIKNHVGELDHLIVSPDGALEGLPFELLLTDPPPRRRDGRIEWAKEVPYLLASTAVEIVPSLALWDRETQMSFDADNWTVFAPAVAKAAVPSWITSLKGDVILDQAATVATARSTMAAADGALVVVAASANEGESEVMPTPSALLFGGEGSWFADEIADAKCVAKLVALSADGAANGPWVPGEGAQSLAHAFLVAGALAVCASVLPVPVSDEILPAFIKELEGGEIGAAQAMRLAQRSAARNGRHPAHWAGWRVISARVKRRQRLA